MPEAAASSAPVTSIPITKPFIGAEELEAVREPLESGWLVQGPQVGRFEQLFASMIDSPEAVATTSCTTALHLAMAVLGVKPGDEVIVPAFTWVSTANVVEYMGATPVFVDVELETFNIDPAQIGNALSDATVGLMPVHLFGLCAKMGPILELAAERRLWVVEDAACAFGAWQDGKAAGTLADMGCFSFHPRKSVTTGEGGMLTTSNSDWADGARSLRDHGASRSDIERHTQPRSYELADYELLGFNYRMTDLQAAVGCVQLERAEWILGQRRLRAERYNELLSDLGWLNTPAAPAGDVHGWQAYVCLVHGGGDAEADVDALVPLRNELMSRLEERGVATRPGTHAPVETGYYARKYGFEPGQFPRAHLAAQLSVALPLYPQMTDAEQDFVVDSLLDVSRDLF